MNTRTNLSAITAVLALGVGGYAFAASPDSDFGPPRRTTSMKSKRATARTGANGFAIDVLAIRPSMQP